MFIFKDKNPDGVLFKLLCRLNVAYERKSILNDLEKHPYYPSLLSISDVLTTINVEHKAFQMNSTEISHMLPVPFVANARFNGHFVLVEAIDESAVYLSDQKWNKKKVRLDDFKNTFRGTILMPSAIADSEHSKAFKINSPLISEMLFITATLLLAGLISFKSGFFFHLRWQLALWTSMKGIGLITSIMLLIQSNAKSEFIQKICHLGSKTSCDSILESNAAKLTDGLSWSEIGFFYFMGTFLLNFFGRNQPGMLTISAILTILSLPYTFYSIYYQYLIAKKWCILCCTVQAVLWLEFFAILLNRNGHADVNIGDLPATIICLLSPPLVWYAFKPLIGRRAKADALASQLRAVKFNDKAFETVLKAQEWIDQPDKSWSIALGNENAEHIVTMVTNPYCSPCALTHKLLHELLMNNTNVQARIVFAVSNDATDSRAQISRHLLALSEKAHHTVIAEAMSEWYKAAKRDYEAWSRNFPVEITNAEYIKIDRHNSWYKEANIKSTPALFVNGYRLPVGYELSDLRYLLH
jgi:uncharacterized membrane protein